jgi:hypothetical protein
MCGKIKRLTAKFAKDAAKDAKSVELAIDLLFLPKR